MTCDNNHIFLSYVLCIRYGSLEYMMEVYLGIPYPQHASITIFPCLMYYVLDIEFWQFEVRGYHNSTYKDQP